METSDELLREIIKASNRTTRAVRAFVRFLFIQLTCTSIAVVLGLIGQESGSSFWTAAASVVWIFGVVVSSREGWRELDLSDPQDATPATEGAKSAKRAKTKDECRYCQFEMKAGEKSCGSCGRMQFGL